MRAINVVTTRTIITCIGIIGLIGCGTDDTSPGQPHESDPPAIEGEPIIGQSMQSDCKPSLYSLGGEEGDAVTATVDGDSVTITHVDANYNCASELELTVSIHEATRSISIQETITNPGELAKCVCNYDLSVTIDNLADGTYTVLMYNDEGADAGQTSFAVGQTPLSYTAGPTEQSQCKLETYSSEDAAAESIQASVEEGALTISHVDALYNCAAKLKMEVSVDGDQNAILVQEVRLNPDENVRCVCNFDLSIQVFDLVPGMYTVTVVDSEGGEAGQTSVSVESSL